MTDQLISLPKANSIVILKTLEDMTAHIQKIQAAEGKTLTSVVYVSCKNFASQPHDLASASLVKDFLEQIMYRTRVGCLNLFAWFKYRESNVKFADIVKLTSKLKTVAQVNSFLSHHHTVIKEQLRNLIELEKRDFSIAVIKDFHEVPSNYQPVVASLIHKLIKGTPMYFRILSVGEPIVFKRHTTGEIGIQRNHDYIEVREN